MTHLQAVAGRHFSRRVLSSKGQLRPPMWREKGRITMILLLSPPEENRCMESLLRINGKTMEEIPIHRNWLIRIIKTKVKTQGQRESQGRVLFLPVAEN